MKETIKSYLGCSMILLKIIDEETGLSASSLCRKQDLESERKILNKELKRIVKESKKEIDTISVSDVMKTFIPIPNSKTKPKEVWVIRDKRGNQLKMSSGKMVWPSIGAAKCALNIHFERNWRHHFSNSKDYKILMEKMCNSGEIVFDRIA